MNLNIRFFKIFILSISLFLINLDVSSFALKRTGALGEESRDIATFDYEKATHTLELVSDSTGLPLCYYASLVTPVCNDSICEVLYVDVYWDLLGNYLRFDTLPGLSLTKFDHAAFSSEDYQKLNQILLASDSPLGDLEKCDLVNNEDQFASGVIDAISGATNVDIANATVEGAVYTCYILWQIVHNQTHDLLLSHTESILDGETIRFMLNNGNFDYQIYLLKSFAPEDYLIYQDDILRLLGTASSEVLSCLLELMPSDFLLLESVQRKMCSDFTYFSVLLRYKFLMRLSRCNSVSISCLELLSIHVEVMTYMQAQEYADILVKYKADLTDIIFSNIKVVVESPNYRHSYVFDNVISAD